MPSLSQNALFTWLQHTDLQTPALLSNPSALGKVPGALTWAVGSGSMCSWARASGDVGAPEATAGLLEGPDAHPHGDGAPSKGHYSETEVSSQQTGWPRVTAQAQTGQQEKAGTWWGVTPRRCHTAACARHPQSHTAPRGPPASQPQPVPTNSRDKPLPPQEASL